MEAQQPTASSHEGPAYWNDSFVEYANTLGGLQLTTAECSMLADVIQSARRASSASSVRSPRAYSPRDRRPSEPGWHTLIPQPLRPEQHRISKQQRQTIDRTKWNRSKAMTKSVTAEDSLSAAWIRHQERQSVWSEPTALPHTYDAASPVEDGCLAPALLHRESTERLDETPVPDFSIPDLELDYWPQTFISVPWS